MHILFCYDSGKIWRNSNYCSKRIQDKISCKRLNQGGSRQRNRKVILCRHKGYRPSTWLL